MDVLPDRLEQVARTFLFNNGTVAQARHGINLIGVGMTISMTDNPTATVERVDVTLTVADSLDDILMLGGM